MHRTIRNGPSEEANTEAADEASDLNSRLHTVGA